MIKKLPGEIWRQLIIDGGEELRNRYAVSTMGRIASYKENILEDGKILKGSLTTGYRTLNLHRPGHKGTLYIHREIARIFLKKSSQRHQFVIHRNHNKLDNRLRNLKWATAEEMIKHQQNSPAKIAYKQKQANRDTGLKLNATQVRRIKKMLNDARRKLTIKQLAEKYEVSEMTMYRIKSGENWGRI
jgi:hypothetical protein